MSASTLPALALPVGGTLRVQDRALCSLHLAEGSTLDAPNLVRVDGTVTIGAGAKLKAPKFASCGALQLGAGGEYSTPQLKMAGEVEIERNAVLDAPLLETVADLRLQTSSTLAAPKLLRVADDLTLEDGCCLDAPALEEIGGEFCLLGAVVSTPALGMVGLIDLGAGSRFVATKLGKCGDLYAEKGAILVAEKLEQVRTVYLGPTASIELPSVCIIQGDLGLGESARLYARKLEHVLGDAHFSLGSFGYTEEIPTIDGTMDHGSVLTPWNKFMPKAGVRL